MEKLKNNDDEACAIKYYYDKTIEVVNVIGRLLADGPDCFFRTVAIDPKVFVEAYENIGFLDPDYGKSHQLHWDYFLIREKINLILKEYMSADQYGTNQDNPTRIKDVDETLSLAGEFIESSPSLFDEEIVKMLIPKMISGYAEDREAVRRGPFHLAKKRSGLERQIFDYNFAMEALSDTIRFSSEVEYFHRQAYHILKKKEYDGKELSYGDKHVIMKGRTKTPAERRAIIVVEYLSKEVIYDLYKKNLIDPSYICLTK